MSKWTLPTEPPKWILIHTWRGERGHKFELVADGRATNLIRDGELVSPAAYGYALLNEIERLATERENIGAELRSLVRKAEGVK